MDPIGPPLVLAAGAVADGAEYVRQYSGTRDVGSSSCVCQEVVSRGMSGFLLRLRCGCLTHHDCMVRYLREKISVRSVMETRHVYLLISEFRFHHTTHAHNAHSCVATARDRKNMER